MRNFVAIILFVEFMSFAMGQASAEQFSLSYNSDWPPYSHGAGPSIGGILPKLMREIVEKRMGISVSENGAPWKRAQSMVERGQLDGFVTVPTANRLKYAYRSRNIVYTLKMRPVVKRGGNAFRQLSEASTIDTVRKLRICDILGNQWAETFYGKNRIKFTPVSKAKTCMKMVHKNRFDTIIQPTATSFAEMENTGLSKDLTVMPVVLGKMEFTLLISKKSKFGKSFMDRFDATLDAMKKDGSYQQLVDRLIGTDFDD